MNTSTLATAAGHAANLNGASGVIHGTEGAVVLWLIVCLVIFGFRALLRSQ